MAFYKASLYKDLYQMVKGSFIRILGKIILNQGVYSFELLEISFKSTGKDIHLKFETSSGFIWGFAS